MSTSLRRTLKAAALIGNREAIYHTAMLDPLAPLSASSAKSAAWSNDLLEAQKRRVTNIK